MARTLYFFFSLNLISHLIFGQEFNIGRQIEQENTALKDIWDVLFEDFCWPPKLFSEDSFYDEVHSIWVHELSSERVREPQCTLSIYNQLLGEAYLEQEKGRIIILDKAFEDLNYQNYQSLPFPELGFEDYYLNMVSKGDLTPSGQLQFTRIVFDPTFTFGYFVLTFYSQDEIVYIEKKKNQTEWKVVFRAIIRMH